MSHTPVRSLRSWNNVIKKRNLCSELCRFLNLDWHCPFRDAPKRCTKYSRCSCTMSTNSNPKIQCNLCRCEATRAATDNDQVVVKASMNAWLIRGVEVVGRSTGTRDALLRSLAILLGSLTLKRKTSKPVKNFLCVGHRSIGGVGGNSPSRPGRGLGEASDKEGL